MAMTGSSGSDTPTSVEDEVEALLARCEHVRARAAIEAARRRPGVDTARLDALADRCERQARWLGFAQRYDAARERGDFLTARDQASAAADFLGPKDAGARWRAAATIAAENVRTAWRIGQLEVDASPPADLSQAAEGLDLKSMLADGGDVLVSVSRHERFLFIRETDVQGPRLRRMGWLRPPEPLGDIVGFRVRGSSLWIAGSLGLVLELRRAPLDVLRCLSLQPYLVPDGAMGRATFARDGRYMWVELGAPGDAETLGVYDLARETLRSRIDTDCLQGVTASQPPEVLLRTFEKHWDRCWLSDATGTPLSPQPIEVGTHVTEIMSHPRGRGYVALVAEDVEPPLEDDDGLNGYEVSAIVELGEGNEDAELLVLEGTDPDSIHELAMDAASRHVFVRTWKEDAPQLFAFRCTANGLRRSWEQAAPRRSTVVRTEDGRRAALLSDVGRLRVDPLGSEAPGVVEGDAPRAYGLESAHESPRVSRDVLHDEAMERLRTDRPLEPWVEKRRRGFRSEPEALARLVRVLDRFRHFDLAESVLAFARVRTPSHPHLDFVEGERRAAADDWEKALELLTSAVDGGVDADDENSAWRMIAEGSLRLKDMARARSALAASTPTESFYSRQLTLEEVAAILESPAEAHDSWGALVAACRAADQSSEPESAWCALDMSAVWERLELQSAARLAAAHLDASETSGLREVRGIMAVARFLDYGRPGTFRRDFPGLGWHSGKIEELREQARAALSRWKCVPTKVLPSAQDLLPTELVVEPSEEREHTFPSSNDPVELRAEPHRLPLLPHERFRQAVPAAAAATEDVARRIRKRPEWDGARTWEEEILSLRPFAPFDAEWARIHRHLEVFTNFELHGRKLFYVEGGLASMLAATTLDVEAQALRGPFPTFGVVFSDETSLQMAREVFSGTAGGTPEAWAAYIVEHPAPTGHRRWDLFLALSTTAGGLPELLVTRLHLDDERSVADVVAAAPVPRRPLVALVDRKSVV